jgi:hypothetical protein
VIGHHGRPARVGLEHVAEGVGPFVPWEVHVDVRRIAASHIEEALEEEVVLQRIHVGDAQAVTDDAGRRGPPAAGPGGVGNDVVDHQEVAGEALGPDDVQLVGQPAAHVGPQGPVSADGPGGAEPLELFEGLIVAQAPEGREHVAAGNQEAPVQARGQFGGPAALTVEHREMLRRLPVAADPLLLRGFIRSRKLADRDAEVDGPQQVDAPALGFRPPAAPDRCQRFYAQLPGQGPGPAGRYAVVDADEYMARGVARSGQLLHTLHEPAYRRSRIGACAHLAWCGSGGCGAGGSGPD